MNTKASKNMKRRVGLSLGILGTCIGAILWDIQYQHMQAVAWLSKFDPPASAQLITFTNLTSVFDRDTVRNCYPGDCYLVKGVVTNQDSEPHSIKFTIDYYAKGKYSFTSSADGVQLELSPRTSKNLQIPTGSTFGGSDSDTPVARVYSIDGDNFDSRQHCTRTIDLYVITDETCTNGLSI